MSRYPADDTKAGGTVNVRLVAVLLVATTVIELAPNTPLPSETSTVKAAGLTKLHAAGAYVTTNGRPGPVLVATSVGAAANEMAFTLTLPAPVVKQPDALSVTV